MSQYTQVRELFWPKGPRPDVWAILDGARHPNVYRAILSSHNISSCLYAGDISDALERCAPHLVQLDYEDTRLTKRLLESAWDDNWGVFLRCDISMPRLRRHLRRSLVVRSQSGKRMVFRYYDPRVLRLYLPTCFTEELDYLYGPIERVWTAGEDSPQLMTFLRKNRALVVEKLRLTGEDAGVITEPTALV
jgi:hypothetical protein